MSRLTVTKIVKRWKGKRKPGKKAHKWEPTTYVFPSEFAAQRAFWSIRENQPKKELNRFGNEIIVQS